MYESLLQHAIYLGDDDDSDEEDDDNDDENAIEDACSMS